MPNQDIRDAVTNDCADVWSKATIRKFMPDEYKNEAAAALAKKKHEKDRLLSVTGDGQQFTNENNAGMNPAQEGSVSPTGQESTSFEDTDRGPDVKPVAQTVNKLQNELKSVREVLESEIENKNKRIKELLEGQDLKDIPELVDNKIGPIKMQNLSKINQYDRRGYQILANRFGELIRRKIAAEGKASIKFYITAKDRTTNIEYMVPVSFTVDMTDKSTDMVLDESRL
jgi:hypothetical protein